ncbi:MAG: DUF3820 family protein [Myxococcales bacterium FL481]|nr:MAG: DUF3820 family protein [Myxococcales bacterium FL481]
MTHTLTPDLEDLRRLVTWRMPFGRYEGRYLTDLPEPYLVWFANKGFPRGKLGELLQTALAVRTNGLEALVDELRVEVLAELRRERSRTPEAARDEPTRGSSSPE